MVRPLRLILVIAVSIASARADLQLVPRLDEYELDGAKLKQLAFSDGDKKVTYQSPHGWEYSGTATQLTLRPPKKNQASATISRISLQEPGKLDEENMKRLATEAVAGAPSGSQNVTIVSQEKNAPMINRKETLLVILSYSFYGESYNRSILFLNRGNEQIRCQLTCHAADFKELQKVFMSSQYSWQNL